MCAHGLNFFSESIHHELRLLLARDALKKTVFLLREGTSTDACAEFCRMNGLAFDTVMDRVLLYRTSNGRSLLRGCVGTVMMFGIALLVWVFIVDAHWRYWAVVDVKYGVNSDYIIRILLAVVYVPYWCAIVVKRVVSGDSIRQIKSRVHATWKAGLARPR